MKICNSKFLRRIVAAHLLAGGLIGSALVFAQGTGSTTEQLPAPAPKEVASATKEPASAPKPATPAVPVPLPTLKIERVEVIAKGSPIPTKCPIEPRIPTPEGEALVLHGPGDIEVTLDAESYLNERKYSNFVQKPSRIFINGVNMGEDAKLIRQWRCVDTAGEHVHLRYQMNAGKSSQVLWESLYRSSGLTNEESLNVAIGWDKDGPNSRGPSSIPPAQSPDWKITVTQGWLLGFAAIVLILTAITTYVVFSSTDAVRDAPTPMWAKRAQEGIKRLPKKTRDANGNVDVALSKAAVVARLNDVFPGVFVEADKTGYLRAAAIALEGGEAFPVTVAGPPAPAAAFEDCVVFGLLLRGDQVPPILGTYSLARVQLGIWFLFAITTGVFLWIVYGQLPKIDGSLLWLLGLSGATSAVSLAIDKGDPSTPVRFMLSQGFWKDLVSGWDNNKQKIYRYQAVVVNLLLLAVGIAHVIQTLSFPVFDATWLAFLGISGAALVGGKGIDLERSK